jgi:c-di-GMP-binding flagellar brake protein YcgR
MSNILDEKYKLKSGQINFENVDISGSYACVVIKDGKFTNLTRDLRMQLVKLLQEHDCNPPQPKVEDMF